MNYLSNTFFQIKYIFTMQKILVALCALVISATAFAQTAQPARTATTQEAPKGKGGKAREAMKNAGVTPEEQAKLKAAREATKAEREAIKKDASLGANDRQAKLKALNEAQKGKVEDIIGKEKAEKLRAERDARKAARKAAKGAKNDQKGEPKSDKK